MNSILAKLKRLRKNVYRKVLSDCNLYEMHTASTNDYPVYNSDHNLDEDSWFAFNDFSKSKYFIDLLNPNFDFKDINDIKRDQFSEMAYLCAIQDGEFYFQKITPSTYLSRKKLLHFGETVTIEDSSNRLLVCSIPDAIYKKKFDTLIFKNLSAIASIFPGIDELYKEATKAQVVNFLENNLVSLTNKYSSDSVSKPNRKRIGLAIATLDAMSAKDRGNIILYIKNYSDGRLKFNNKTNSFEISTDEELKNLLYGIEQRFYTTAIGKVKRIANSVQNI